MILFITVHYGIIMVVFIVARFATVTSSFTNSHFHVKYYCHAIVKQAIYYIITDVNEKKSKLEKCKKSRKKNKAVSSI